MNKQTITDIDEILTIVAEDKVYRILDVAPLLKKHPPEAVVGFLNLLRSDFKKELKKLILHNKTDPQIDELVAKNFRLRMAINLIRNTKQAKQSA